VQVSANAALEIKRTARAKNFFMNDFLGRFESPEIGGLRRGRSVPQL
jgi:hypothetical protein